MNLKCLIVDDEPIAQNIIKGYINDTPKLEILGICNNAMEALQILRLSSADILFLDIEMPKISGLSFLKTLTQPPETIITTAYREFALEGFELNVVDYLLKPFSFERFLKAINKTAAYHRTAVRSSNQFSKKFEYFKADRKNIKVYYDEILFIEGLSNYVKIHLENNHLIVYQRLIDLENKLPKQQFIRIHKSFIVSLSKIKAYSSDYVEIMDKKLSIGNTYKQDFIKAISSE